MKIKILNFHQLWVPSPLSLCLARMEPMEVAARLVNNPNVDTITISSFPQVTQSTLPPHPRAEVPSEPGAVSGGGRPLLMEATATTTPPPSSPPTSPLLQSQGLNLQL